MALKLDVHFFQKSKERKKVSLKIIKNENSIDLLFFCSDSMTGIDHVLKL